MLSKFQAPDKFPLYASKNKGLIGIVIHLGTHESLLDKCYGWGWKEWQIALHIGCKFKWWRDKCTWPTCIFANILQRMLIFPSLTNVYFRCDQLRAEREAMYQSVTVKLWLTNKAHHKCPNYRCQSIALNIDNVVRILQCSQKAYDGT